MKPSDKKKKTMKGFCWRGAFANALGVSLPAFDTVLESVLQFSLFEVRDKRQSFGPLAVAFPVVMDAAMVRCQELGFLNLKNAYGDTLNELHAMLTIYGGSRLVAPSKKQDQEQTDQTILSAVCTLIECSWCCG